VTGNKEAFKKTESSVRSKELKHNNASRGARPSTSQIMLFLDADDTASENGGTIVNNQPDSVDAHGASGSCMNFVDGHAEWVRSPDYHRVLNFSQDGNSTWQTPGSH